MSIRRKKGSGGKLRQDRQANFCNLLQRALQSAEAEVAQTISSAARELQQEIAQARETISEAEKAMAAGTQTFQQAIETCQAVSAAASKAAAGSVSSGEAGVKQAMDNMLQGLKNISAGMGAPAGTGTSSKAVN